MDRVGAGLVGVVLVTRAVLAACGARSATASLEQSMVDLGGGAGGGGRSGGGCWRVWRVVVWWWQGVVWVCVWVDCVRAPEWLLTGGTGVVWCGVVWCGVGLGEGGRPATHSKKSSAWLYGSIGHCPLPLLVPVCAPCSRSGSRLQRFADASCPSCPWGDPSACCRRRRLPLTPRSCGAARLGRCEWFGCSASSGIISRNGWLPCAGATLSLCIVSVVSRCFALCARRSCRASRCALCFGWLSSDLRWLGFRGGGQGLCSPWLVAWMCYSALA